MLSMQVAKKKQLYHLLAQNNTCPYNALTQRYSKCDPWPGTSSPCGNSVEMQILRPHPDLLGARNLLSQTLQATLIQSQVGKALP